MVTDPLAGRPFQHPAPGWLTLDEVARHLTIDRDMLERLVATRSLRHERNVVLGEVIVHIPLTEVYRLERLLSERGRRAAPAAAGSPTEIQSAQSGLPPHDVLEERERAFAALGTLRTARIRELEQVLSAARTEIAQTQDRLRASEAERTALVEERRHLVHTVASLEHIRDRLTELVQNTAHESQIHALREALGASRARLAQAEERLHVAASLERRLNQVSGELDTSWKLVARQAHEIEVLRDIERNNQRYIDRLERRLGAR